MNLGHMRIKLKSDDKPIKHMIYCLNPRFKEKFQKEIDRMVAAGLIFPVDEAKWISSIVI
jgi:hypothetical protein